MATTTRNALTSINNEIFYLSRLIHLSAMSQKLNEFITISFYYIIHALTECFCALVRAYVYMNGCTFGGALLRKTNGRERARGGY